MSEIQKDKKVNFSYNTTKEYLQFLGIFEEDIIKIVKYFTDLFGTRYLKVFQTKLNNSDISRLKYIHEVFSKIDHCRGIKRLIHLMDRNNFEHHLFTVKAAGWLVDFGYDVEFEPEICNENSGLPDLLISNGSWKLAVECKDIDNDEFFNKEYKKKIADFIYDTIKTCDQVDIYLKEEVTFDEIQELFSDLTIISTIYKAGFKSPETRFLVSPQIEIGLIRKPTIVGRESDFLETTMGMILEDNSSSVRLPGFAFMKGGRSVGVYGPPPDLNRRWNNKRSKSKKQAIDGMPLLVLINGDNVLGDPELHRNFFEHVWLTEKNDKCSALGILKFVTLQDQTVVDYFENKYAESPIHRDFKEKICISS